MKQFVLSCISAAMLFSCKTGNQTPEEAPKPYSEQHRPQFHFSPQANWMNDPNGMVYYEGEYHLFYQYYPEGDVWGPMHWGHAISRDMIHWEHLPIALYPDSLGYIFSGSAVVDYKNTSGFGTADSPALVAIYTNHSAEVEKERRNDYQTQSIAYSTDRGRTWIRYEHNPVLKNPGINDFRDPKVFWHTETEKWIMILAVYDHVELYGSKDLKSWSKLSEFGKTHGTHDGVWECPDLFPLKVNGTDQKKWVMLVSLTDGGPSGGSATQYFIGEFNGTEFVNDNSAETVLWIDHGSDNYAGVTWSDIPEDDGRKIFLGWMSNWKYATVVPTSPWRSAMTIPRQLTLLTNNDAIRLASAPVAEVEKIVNNTKSFSSLSVSEPFDLSGKTDFPISTCIISGKVKRGDFAFEFSNSLNQKLLIGYDLEHNQYFIDRKNSGKVDFSEHFSVDILAPGITENDTLVFTMVVDVSSIEVFFDGGLTVMTSLFFPDEKFSLLKIHGKSFPVEIDSLKIKQITTIW